MLEPKMRFLVDECTGASVIEYLRKKGHDVLSVAETTPRATDTDILTRAAQQDRIMVTNDKDFGDLVFHSGGVHSGVLLLRLRDESPANKVAVTAAVLNQYAERLPGNFVAASETRIRVREPIKADDASSIEEQT
jgi:predicted nuclease of predicted toxin-antitoxin system